MIYVMVALKRALQRLRIKICNGCCSVSRDCGSEGETGCHTWMSFAIFCWSRRFVRGVRYKATGTESSANSFTAWREFRGTLVRRRMMCSPPA